MSKYTKWALLFIALHNILMGAVLATGPQDYLGAAITIGAGVIGLVAFGMLSRAK